MLGSCCFYWFGSWYIEKVFPGDYGIPLPWNFLFPRAATSDRARPSSFATSSIRLSSSAILHVDRIALNDVSFDLYEDQITSLLGPNGSGKTTLFNYLIGMYGPTSGRILFDLLTIEEQLQFYATVRGFGANRKAIAAEILQLVDLQASRDRFCRSLCGGMKRRLSLACAFIGDTKIVLLDGVRKHGYLW